MSEAMDIRVWARDNGLDIASKGKIPDGIRQQWLLRDEQYSDEPVLNGQVHDEVSETRKEDAQPKPAQKRSWWQKPRNEPSPPGSSRKRRVSTDQVISMAWSLGGALLAQNRKIYNDGNEVVGLAPSPMLPVARVLQLQAPVAGIVLDDVVKGTVMDKVLQPMARAGEKAEKVAAIAGPPIIVAAITINPQIMPIARPMLKACLMSWIEIAGPAMKKAEAKMQRMAEAVGESGIDIDTMIDQLFAPPDGWTPPSEDEEHAAQRAAEY